MCVPSNHVLKLLWWAPGCEKWLSQYSSKVDIRQIYISLRDVVHPKTWSGEDCNENRIRGRLIRSIGYFVSLFFNILIKLRFNRDLICVVKRKNPQRKILEDYVIPECISRFRVFKASFSSIEVLFWHKTFYIPFCTPNVQLMQDFMPHSSQ